MIKSVKKLQSDTKYLAEDLGSEWLVSTMPFFPGPFQQELDQVLNDIVKSFHNEKNKKLCRVEIGTESQSVSVIMPTDGYFRDFGLTYIGLADGLIGKTNTNTMITMYINTERLRIDLAPKINSLLRLVSKRKDMTLVVNVTGEGAMTCEISANRPLIDAGRGFNDMIKWYNALEGETKIPKEAVILETPDHKRYLLDQPQEIDNETQESAEARAAKFAEEFATHMTAWLDANGLANYKIKNDNGAGIVFKGRNDTLAMCDLRFFVYVVGDEGTDSDGSLIAFNDDTSGFYAEATRFLAMHFTSVEILGIRYDSPKIVGFNINLYDGDIPFKQ